MPLVLYGHLKNLAIASIRRRICLCFTRLRVVESFVARQSLRRDALVAIVSRWPEFLRWARTMLVAAGLDADALSFRDARERDWEKGLRSATFVITDSLMAPRIPAGCEVKVFRVLAESSLKRFATTRNGFSEPSAMHGCSYMSLKSALDPVLLLLVFRRWRGADVVDYVPAFFFPHSSFAGRA